MDIKAYLRRNIANIQPILLIRVVLNSPAGKPAKTNNSLLIKMEQIFKFHININLPNIKPYSLKS